MKKFLNWVISLVGFILLIGLLLLSLNDVIGFMDTSGFQGFIDFVQRYGAVIVVGALVFVNIIGKGVIRIILTILFLGVAAFYIFSTAFPSEFINLFGIV